MENAEVKKLLVVIDYQNDFVSGVLGSESAKRIEDPIMKLLTEFSPTGYAKRVAFTQDSHAECSYMSTREGKHLPVPHCLMDTDGGKLYGKVGLWYDNHKDNEFVSLVEKSGFGSLDLTGDTDEEEKFSRDLDDAFVLANRLGDEEGSEDDPYWKKYGEMINDANIGDKMYTPDEIHICGVATNICVISNAIILQTRYPQAEIYIHKTACASYDNNLHEMALKIMEGLGMNVID